MRHAIEPYQPLLSAVGLDAVTAVQWLLGAHGQLSNPDQSERHAFFIRLANHYGIDLFILMAALQAEAETRRRIARLRKEVNEFADTHPLFDELYEQMLPMIEAGASLEEAHRRAIANKAPQQRAADSDEVRRVDAH